MQIAVFIFALAAVALAEIPPYIHVCCKMEDKQKLNSCVKQSILDLRPNFRDGMPELQAPSIEPFMVEHLVLANSDNLKAVGQNVMLNGLTTFDIQKLNFDLDEQVLEIDLTFRELTGKGRLDLSATVVVPLGGTGSLDFKTENVAAVVKLKYDIVNHKGAKHIFFSSSTLKLVIKDYSSVFVSDKGAENTLSVAINAVLDNARPDIIEELTPNLEQSITKIFLDLANKVCKNLTYDEMFPKCN